VNSENQFGLVALLPMRGQSERVLDKNFRPLGDRPLFHWILRTLLNIPELDRVIINTDNVEKVAHYGIIDAKRVILRDRRPEICGDKVSMNLVLADDIAAVSAETYLMTHATNPFLNTGTVQRALKAYADGIAAGTCDSLFSVNRFQTRFYRSDGSPVNHDPNVLMRTQDLEPWFEENSNLYLFSRASFLSTNARIGRKPVLFETPRAESIDIDDSEGWEMAARLAGSFATAKAGERTLDA